MRAILDCGCVIHDAGRVWCPSCLDTSLRAKVKPQRKPGADPMLLQSEEFNRLQDLCRAFNSLPAVVDDDYPECRHYYDRALDKFIEALRNNGRIL